MFDDLSLYFSLNGFMRFFKIIKQHLLVYIQYTRHQTASRCNYLFQYTVCKLYKWFGCLQKVIFAHFFSLPHCQHVSNLDKIVLPEFSAYCLHPYFGTSTRVPLKAGTIKPRKWLSAFVCTAHPLTDWLVTWLLDSYWWMGVQTIEKVH